MENTYKVTDGDISLTIHLTGEHIEHASANKEDKYVDAFCQTITKMKVADAAYYGAKMVLEANTTKTHTQNKGILFVSSIPSLATMDTLIKEVFNLSKQPDSARYTSTSYQAWANLNDSAKESAIKTVLDRFFDGNTLYDYKKVFINCKGTCIKVDLSSLMPKSQFHHTLIELEAQTRVKLNGVPVIFVLEEIKDANTKRK
ncbi:hypothetical protein DXX93_05360 [Thalassotalea euphylliae]|uniref:Uncharacterized protein n=1 Tax=Thalassotalea euphylliae TaxID=1655234 RepID=A0A3E0TQ14_9GAMM|nr:hypothetical protein [Thalassotalea euphylliae]REL26055.1 hypothetical protein DXX93_05360 [Thalassotalea euphylliae]